MKKLGLMIILIIIFIGCGGGGSSSSSSEKYDMWDYIASKTSKTYILDSYKSNSTYSNYTNKVSDAGYIEYTVISSTRKIVDFNGELTATWVLNGNTINVEASSIDRYKSLGSRIGECTLSKHYDSFTIAKQYTFSDVLQFDCDGYKEFYVKNKGNIINYAKSTYSNGRNETVRYTISVANNADD